MPLSTLHQQIWQLLTHSQREEEEEWEETQTRQVSVYMLRVCQQQRVITSRNQI